MARIVVISHEFDWVAKRRGFFKPAESAYFIHGVLQEMKRRGHSWVEARGVRKVLAGDVALMHLNASTTPAEYIEYGRRYRVCLNVGSHDILKSSISTAVVRPGDDWDGPVIVKSVLNYGGIPERRLNKRARKAGRPEPFPNAYCLENYGIYERASDAPPDAFGNPNLLVERFIPEHGPDGYATRHWMFLGQAETCVRAFSTERLIKGRNFHRYEMVEVPDVLRRRRRELGLDYGKFDFVVHGDEVTLLDANRTVGAPPMEGDYRQIYSMLADGFEGMMR